MKQIIEVVREFTIPPFKENSFVEVVMSSDGADRFKVTMHKDKLELMRVLKRLQKSANIYDENMNAIWSMIERYAHTQFVLGSAENTDEE
jgi:hypothetical protein